MFDATQLDAVAERRLRGLVLELVWTRHQQQGSHMDNVMLWGLVNKVAGFSVGEAKVITVLQDLGERRYLSFVEKKNRWTNKVEISRIGITPVGRDLVEHNREDDPAVLTR